MGNVTGAVLRRLSNTANACGRPEPQPVSELAGGRGVEMVPAELK
jgi:hypothetical protein